MNYLLPITTKKNSLLRWEITMALFIKLVLLTGLWFLIFHWGDKLVSKPDIARHFALPVTPKGETNRLMTPPQKDTRHDR